MPGVADERVEDAEVGAVVVGQRRERMVVRRLRREAALHVRRQVEPEHVRRQRDLAQRQVAVGSADDADAAVAELEIVLCHLELVSAAMRLIFSFTSAAAPATAPETMTV